MRTSRTRFLALLLLVGLTGCGGALSASGARGDAVAVNIAFPIEEFDLPNGLHVVLHREPSARSSLVHVRYHVGSKDDPQGRAGFAHFYEHLMFLGSRNTGTKDYMEWIDEVGGHSNASTDLDTTDYYAYVPPSQLARAIWLEADRMAYPLAKVDEQSFTHERDVVKNEWREHYEDVPLGNLGAIARERIFGAAHPYGRRTIGRGEELDRSTLAEAHAFGRAYYRPNNATIVVCGVFDSVKARELVTRYFATIPAGPTPPSHAVAPPQPKPEQRIALEADIAGPAVAIAWPAPATHGDGSEELSYGLTLFAGQVRRRLVTEKKTAISVRTGYEHGRLGGMVTVTVQLRKGESPETAISVIDEYLTNASSIALRYSDEVLKNYKTRAVVSEVAALEGLEGRALRILHDIDMHGAPNAVQKDLRHLLSVHPADVGGAVEHFLIDGPRLTMVVRPKVGAPRSGRMAP